MKFNKIELYTITKFSLLKCITSLYTMYSLLSYSTDETIIKKCLETLEEINIAINFTNKNLYIFEKNQQHILNTHLNTIDLYIEELNLVDFI